MDSGKLDADGPGSDPPGPDVDEAPEGGIGTPSFLVENIGLSEDGGTGAVPTCPVPAPVVDALEIEPPPLPRLFMKSAMEAEALDPAAASDAPPVAIAAPAAAAPAMSAVPIDVDPPAKLTSHLAGTFD